MRILHLPYTFFPDPVGGTEVYVEGLARYQRTLGCEAAVAAPVQLGSRSSRYDYAGTPVWRFAVSPSPTLRELYGEGDRVAAQAFGRVMNEFQPHVVHFHGITGALSVLLADEARQRGASIVFNYHTPAASCGRGTLLRWGKELCDGNLTDPNASPCAACCLQAKGLPRPLASLVASLPEAARRSLEQTELSGGIWTALRMPELTSLRIRAFHTLMQKTDRVVALCQWTHELLRRNGVPDHKLVLCRQGIDWDPAVPAIRRSQPAVRAVFLGRSDPAKGASIVLEALKNDPALPVQLDLFGVNQGSAGEGYAARLQQLIGDDPRIRILPPLAASEVVARLRDYHVLVVPSQCLETGPLVVLEAFAAQIPVIGSNLGGIAELVRDRIDGLLVSPYASVAAWTTALQRIAQEHNLLDSLRAGILPPRHSRNAALELMPVYESVARSACTADARNTLVNG